MKWWRRLTPFRIAVILFVGYQLVLFATTSSNFSGSGGSAWGYVAVMAVLFWGVIFWLVDILMQRIISRIEVIWVIQAVALLTLYLSLDW